MRGGRGWFHRKKTDNDTRSNFSEWPVVPQRLFLQHEWSNREKIMPFIVDFILKNHKWRVSLQTHKYMNIP